MTQAKESSKSRALKIHERTHKEVVVHESEAIEMEHESVTGTQEVSDRLPCARTLSITNRTALKQ